MVMGSKVEINEIHGFYFILFIFAYLPSQIFATMFRETRNQIGVALPQGWYTGCVIVPLRYLGVGATPTMRHHILWDTTFLLSLQPEQLGAPSVMYTTV